MQSWDSHPAIPRAVAALRKDSKDFRKAVWGVFRIPLVVEEATGIRRVALGEPFRNARHPTKVNRSGNPGAVHEDQAATSPQSSLRYAVDQFL
jgi:hypothetical protein